MNLSRTIDRLGSADRSALQPKVVEFIKNAVKEGLMPDQHGGMQQGAQNMWPNKALAERPFAGANEPTRPSCMPKSRSEPPLRDGLMGVLSILRACHGEASQIIAAIDGVDSEVNTKRPAQESATVPPLLESVALLYNEAQTLQAMLELIRSRI